MSIQTSNCIKPKLYLHIAKMFFYLPLAVTSLLVTLIGSVGFSAFLKFSVNCTQNEFGHVYNFCSISVNQLPRASVTNFSEPIFRQSSYATPSKILFNWIQYPEHETWTRLHSVLHPPSYPLL